MNIFRTLCFVLFCILSDLVFGINSKLCSDNNDCLKSNSKCMDSLCVCEPGKVFSSNGTTCLDIALGIGTKCIDNTQCRAWINGPSKCDSNELCTCEEGYRHVDNTCIKYVGFNETCSSNSDCFDQVDLNALKCSNQKCVCNDGYYLRGGYDCRLSAKKSGECFLDLDCESEDKICKFNYGPVGKCVDVSTVDCKTNEDCKNLNNSWCSPFRNKCTCKDNFEYNKENKTCEAETNSPKTESTKIKTSELIFASEIEEPCTTNDNCTHIYNSLCPAFRQKCICKESYIFDKNTNHCVKGVGSTCDPEGQKCEVRHSICNTKDNICQCEKYFIYSPYTNKCFKPTREFNSHSCGSDENCFTFGPHATCINNTCICKFNSVYNKQYMYCEPIQTSGQCENECEDKLHSSCVNGICECNQNYLEDNNKCYPDIGLTCSNKAKDCIIKNAECNKENLCLCKTGHFQNGNRECLEELQSQEDTCESDIQCFKLIGEGAICFNSTCTCSSNYIPNNNTCLLKRKIGNSCSSLTDCKTINSDNVACLNGFCTCDLDYHLSDDKNQCVADSGSIGLNQQLYLFMILIMSTLIFI